MIEWLKVITFADVTMTPALWLQVKMEIRKMKASNCYWEVLMSRKQISDPLLKHASGGGGCWGGGLLIDSDVDKHVTVRYVTGNANTFIWIQGWTVAFAFSSSDWQKASSASAEQVRLLLISCHFAFLWSSFDARYRRVACVCFGWKSKSKSGNKRVTSNDRKGLEERWYWPEMTATFGRDRSKNVSGFMAALVKPSSEPSILFIIPNSYEFKIFL